MEERNRRISEGLRLAWKRRKGKIMGHENGGWMNDDQRGAMREQARKAQLYQKKPIQVKAVQWFPPDDSRHDATEFRVGCEVGMADIGTITVMQPDATNKYYSMKTVSGWVKLEAGDWIITGPTTAQHSRDLYPCKADVFELTYEKVK